VIVEVQASREKNEKRGRGRQKNILEGLKEGVLRKIHVKVNTNTEIPFTTGGKKRDGGLQVRRGK